MCDVPEKSGDPGVRSNPRRGGLDTGDDPRCDTAAGDAKDPKDPRLSALGSDAGPSERWSRAAARVLPAGSLVAPPRRARLQRQQEVSDPSGGGGASLKLSGEAAEKGSLTSAMRKRYLKELLLNNPFRSAFGSMMILQGSGCADGPAEEEEEGGSGGAGGSLLWALDPTEHAWMLSAPDGNYETIAEYLCEDFSLLTRKDFISGFTVLHWLAKYGRDETLVKVLRLAASRGSPVDVNLKGSGGLTPLHVAAMHGQHMVLKILVGAFGADVDVMDYSGRRAWQYLRGGASLEMKELLGACECLAKAVGGQNANNNSSCSACQPAAEAPGVREHVDPPPRTDERGRFGSFKRLFAPLLSFGNLGSRSSVHAHS
ncbi:ankyrin repeat domain-containing protein SOWAHD [Scleropages formosus]|uniref:Sosondowah ankyrin repeat domain family member D n=1 Tax=Scleropages formosus TaxID=113540 RepID=A0A8C9W6C7_SCLFO|nr:ankyrin repeat domain-containing protein SOWAHD [Scleropages formosus]XP_029113396.1 ankyrin repeat domain-containing protein SOWAHD [Scleropages formosus]XP_029113397.1 ankyrin repeat domain-containing protein SOWAHD [Scleropages formosus]